MKGLCPASETLTNYVQRWENSSFSKDILFLAVLHQITGGVSRYLENKNEFLFMRGCAYSAK